MRTGSLWTRLAAASGIGFAGVAVAAYVIGSVKNFPSAAEIATRASSSVWGTWVLLVALAGVSLLWFTATSAARLSQIEGGSGRVATEHRMAGAAIAALLFAEVAVQVAARSGGSGLGALARAIVNGPVLPFAAGVYVLAAGVVGARAGSAIPMFSGVIARVSVLLGLALIAAGGLWLYRDYAWLNDTVFFAFVGWVFVRSSLGAFRWADLDEVPFRVSVAPATRRASAPTTPLRALDLDDTFEVPHITRPARPKSKTSSRGPAKGKPRARKPAARKATTQRKPKPTAKRAPRKPTPPPSPAPEPGPGTTPLAETSEEAPTSSLDSIDFGEPEDESTP